MVFPCSFAARFASVDVGSLLAQQALKLVTSLDFGTRPGEDMLSKKRLRSIDVEFVECVYHDSQPCRHG